MQTVPTRHGALAYDAAGRGSPVVLLHSGGHDRHDFDAIAPALAERHQTLAFDLPGHGDSAMFEPPSSAHAALMGEAIEDAVDALDLAPAVFVGNSVGGTAALHMALRRPSRVRALVLVASSGFVEHTAVSRAFCWSMCPSSRTRPVSSASSSPFCAGSGRPRPTPPHRRARRRRSRERCSAVMPRYEATWRAATRPSSPG